MCRNHRGFIEALVGSNRIGSDVLLLNTSFAGPALAEVVEREGADTVIYDEEFTEIVDRALEGRPDTTRILGWTDSTDAPLTVDKLIERHAGQRPQTQRAQERHHPAHLGNHRNAQGRQAICGQRRCG